jgi:hypothetical protein
MNTLNKKLVLVGLEAVVLAITFAILFAPRNNHPPTPTGKDSTNTATATSTPPTKSPRHLQYVVNYPNTLIVVDPSGKRMGRDYKEIPGSIYYEEGNGGPLKSVSFCSIPIQLLVSTRSRLSVGERGSIRLISISSMAIPLFRVSRVR